MTVNLQSPSREELLGRASDLVPVLKKRAAQTEAQRQIPPETVADLGEAGLFRVPNPERFGGYEHDIDLMFEVAMELGRGCGSTAWCYSVWSMHNWMLGFWPEEAQEEYFATGPNTLSSSSFRPAGNLVPVPGGFRLSGRWDFSSGSDPATWVMVGAMGEKGPVMVLLPRPDYSIVDTWFVSGMRGTGSKDIEIKDVFIPEHRVSAVMREADGAHAFGLHGRQSYLLPPMTMLPFTLCSPLVGLAEGAIEELADRLRGKSGPGRTADSMALQLRLAESAAEADAAKLLVTSTTKGLIAAASRGDLPGSLDQAKTRLRYSFVAKLAVNAVNRLFEASGGHSLFESDPMQRFHRDVHAGSHQGALYWDFAAEGYGRALLDLPPLPPAR